MRYMRLHKLHTNSYTRNFNDNTRKSDCCLAYQQSNSQCWTVTMRYDGKAPFSSTTSTHWFCVVVQNVPTEKPNMRIDVRYSFAFILRLSLSFSLTHGHTHTQRQKLLLYRAHSIWCHMCYTVVLFLASYMWFHWVPCCEKNFALDNEHENTLSCLRITLMCWILPTNG